MWSWRRKGSGQTDLEAALRGRRAETPAGLVEHLSGRVRAEQSPSRDSVGARLAFAAAISVFVVGTFASIGGLSYAASAATSTYRAVTHVAVKKTLKVSVHKSSASDEYPTTKQKTPPAFTPPKPPKKPQTSATKPAVSSVAGSQSSTLPFTGFSLLGTVALSLLLIGVGLTLRRRARRG